MKQVSRLFSWANFEALFGVTIVLVAAFYAWHSPKQKFPFRGISALGVDAAPARGTPPKKKKKKNVGEEKCRRIFESLFGKPFPSVRPTFLQNPVTKKNLELDGYNSTITTPLGKGIAFEYDGVQHAEYLPYFHPQGPKEFEYQQLRDSWKDQRCRQLGLLLVRVPHFVTPENMRSYVVRKLRKQGVRV